MRARIALLPGDGVGPEVTAQAARVLSAVAEIHGHGFELSSYNTSTLIIRKEQMLAPLPTGTMPPAVIPEPVAAH